MSRDLMDMNLTMHEVQSPTWQKLSAYYEALLTKKRAQLENTGATADQRVALCWQIDMIKRFLGHADEAKKKATGAG